MKKLLALASVASLLMTANASATLVSGNSLQNALTATGAVVDVNNDQYTPDTYWMMGSSTVSSANILFELAGFADSTTFGIFDKNNSSNKLQIFNGAAGSGSIALFANSTVPGGKQFCTAALFSSSVTCSMFSGNQFGFYLQSPSGTFYSDTALNQDNVDHMVAYQGNYTPSNPNTINDNPWLANEFVLAWEDLNGGGDRDYDDFVVMVESVVSAPEPTTLGLLGLGLLGLSLRSRKGARARSIV